VPKSSLLWRTERALPLRHSQLDGVQMMRLLTWLLALIIKGLRRSCRGTVVVSLLAIHLPSASASWSMLTSSPTAKLLVLPPGHVHPYATPCDLRLLAYRTSAPLPYAPCCTRLGGTGNAHVPGARPARVFDGAGAVWWRSPTLMPRQKKPD